MVNDSYFRFDDDNTIKYTFSRSSQDMLDTWTVLSEVLYVLRCSDWFVCHAIFSVLHVSFLFFHHQELFPVMSNQKKANRKEYKESNLEM